jgi:hypothetical protein
LSLRAFETLDARIERRIWDLERKVINVEHMATRAWEAEQSRVERTHDFWWNAFRFVAIAQIVLSLGLLVFGTF